MELAVKQREDFAWPVKKWPEDLQGAFNAHIEAFWRDNANDYDCVDNHRCARLDNADEVAEYDEAVRDGCCGFYSETLELCGVKVLWGFNYGH